LYFNISADTLKVRKYKATNDPTRTDIKTLVIPVKFNDESIVNKKAFDLLNDGLTQVISVDYVYTTYENKEVQDRLNKKRLVELYLYSPDMFEQSMTCWRFIEQLGFRNKEDARKLFHGFVIKYQKIIPYRVKEAGDIKKDVVDRMIKPKDSLIHKVFSRNPKLKRELIVADYTCSMSPYYLEVMAWFCLHESKRDIPYAFFNDGDGKPNNKKIIGNTGGVHQFKTRNLDTLVKYVFETIKTGCSGDGPENDIEAVLKGIEKNPRIKEVVMIVDNWSDMRDYRLRFQITKPVRVILCGTKNGINPQYLNLARQTKGSIHTMEEDLEHLYEIQEGETFMLGGQKYIVKQGRIIKSRLH